MMDTARYRALSRRAFLRGGTATGATALLMACGAAAVPTAPPAAAVSTTAAQPSGGSGASTAPVPTAARAATAGASTAAPVAGSRGELRAILGIHFPPTLDAAKDGFTLTFSGFAETLMRLTIAQKLEPWLAESVTNVDPTTWTVKLRTGARFHDGTPVNAGAVAASIRRCWEINAAANRFISKETQLVVVDDTTLQLKTPKPAGDVPFSLATQHFAIHKPGAEANRTIMTGPYRPTKLDVDQLIVAEAFPDHWGGPPPVKTLSIKQVVDANARILALQSGDADLLYGLPPEIVKGVGGEVEKQVIPSTRLHMIMLNHARPLFGERAVREATSFAIDRAALNTVALDGLAAPATGMFPPNSGVDVVDVQRSDPARAQQLLDEAGWRKGADGVRAKEGKRLAFTLYSYPGRAELTPMAVAIQAQLKPLGYDIQVQQVQDITAQIKDGNFDAAFYSVNAVVTGDPQYLFQTLITTTATSNFGKYANAEVDALIEQLRGEPDPAKRQALSRQAQELAGKDVPNLYLVAAPVVSAYRKGKVKGFTLHPNDLYWINRDISVS